MGAEVGATTSTFPYTSNMRSYLIATGRELVAQAADHAAAAGYLGAVEVVQPYRERGEGHALTTDLVYVRGICPWNSPYEYPRRRRGQLASPTLPCQRASADRDHDIHLLAYQGEDPYAISLGKADMPPVEGP